MKINITSLKAALLGLTLLTLSTKGTEEIQIDDNFSFTIDLPTWLIIFKSAVNPTGVGLMALFVFLTILTRKQFFRTPPFIGYIAILTYFFIRSAWLGSNIQLNLLAVAILLAFGFAISLDIGTKKTQGAASQAWMPALNHFCRGYVIASFVLLATGYGYAQVGSRFFGMTYHPNAEGAYAAVCAGFFFTRLLRPGIESKLKLAEFLFFGLALILVIASGSRTGTLMTIFACACLARARYAISAAILSFIAFIILPGAEDHATDASIGGAFSRMINTTSGNRDEVWGILLSDFYAHPLLGVGDTSNVSGSGILSAFSGDGLLGGLVFLSIFVMTTKKAVELIAGFHLHREWSPRLVAAVLMLQLLINSIFEGTLFDKFGPFPLLMLIFLLAIYAKDRKQTTPLERPAV